MQKPAKRTKNINKSNQVGTTKLFLVFGIFFLVVSTIMAFVSGTGPLAYFANSVAVNVVSAKKCQEDPACADLVQAAQRTGIVVPLNVQSSTSNRVVKEVENTVEQIKKRAESEPENNAAQEIANTITSDVTLQPSLATAKVQVESNINNNLVFYKRNSLNNQRQLNCSDGSMRHPLGTTIRKGSNGCETCVVRKSTDNKSTYSEFTPSKCTNVIIDNLTPKCYLFQAKDESNGRQSLRYTTDEDKAMYPNRVAYPANSTKYVVKLGEKNRLIKCVTRNGVGDWVFLK